MPRIIKFVEQRGLRVSDADRQHTGELLQRAVGDGYITLTEFEERTDAVFAAKTRGELDAVVADIPSARPDAQDRPDAQPMPDAQAVERNPRSGGPAQFPAVAQPAAAAETTEIRGTGSEVKRKGPWQVPASLRVRTRLSDTVLDFTEAVYSSPVVDIELDDTMGSTKLIVPEQATLDCDALEVSWGNLDNRVQSGPPRGRPHFVVHGKSKGGDVKIRHPRKGSWWEKLLS